MRIGTVGVVVIATILCGCKGADGATGPQGSVGPVGPAGPGTRVVVTATIDGNGHAVGYAPTSLLATTADLPITACYIEPAQSTGQWQQVTFTPNDALAPTCTLYNADNQFAAMLDHAPVGWNAAFVFVY